MCLLKIKYYILYIWFALNPWLFLFMNWLSMFLQDLFLSKARITYTAFERLLVFMHWFKLGSITYIAIIRFLLFMNLCSMPIRGAFLWKTDNTNTAHQRIYCFMDWWYVQFMIFLAGKPKSHLKGFFFSCTDSVCLFSACFLAKQETHIHSIWTAFVHHELLE